jgi:hypothetical protein
LSSALRLEHVGDHRIARKHHHASEAIPPLAGITKRAGQRDIPVLDITLANTLEGVESLKARTLLIRRGNACNVSFLGGGGESIKVCGAGGRGNRCPFFVKYEDPSQWRDEGESGDAFIRALTETAQAQARDTFATFFLKPSKIDTRLSATKTTTHPTSNELGPRLSAPKTTTRPRRHTFPGTQPFPRPPRRTNFGSSQHLKTSCVSFCCSAKPTAARVRQLHPLGTLACKLLKVSRALRYSLSAVRCLAAAPFPSSNNMRVCVCVFPLLFFFLTLAVFL